MLKQYSWTSSSWYKRMRGLMKQLGSAVSLKIGKICNEKGNQAVLKSKDDMKQKHLGNTHVRLTFFFTFWLPWLTCSADFLFDVTLYISNWQEIFSSFISVWNLSQPILETTLSHSLGYWRLVKCSMPANASFHLILQIRLAHESAQPLKAGFLWVGTC